MSKVRTDVADGWLHTPPVHYATGALRCTGAGKSAVSAVI